MMKLSTRLKGLQASELSNVPIHQTTFDRVIAEAEALEAQIPKWISVEDEFPPQETEVMVFRKDMGFWWGIHLNEIWYVRFGNNWSYVTNVTHWMPVPPVPENEG